MLTLPQPGGIDCHVHLEEPALFGGKGRSSDNFETGEPGHLQEAGTRAESWKQAQEVAFVEEQPPSCPSSPPILWSPSDCVNQSVCASAKDHTLAPTMSRRHPRSSQGQLLYRLLIPPAGRTPRRASIVGVPSPARTRSLFTEDLYDICRTAAPRR